MKIRRAEHKDIPRIHALLLQVELVHHAARPDLFRNGGRKYDDAQLAEIIEDDSRPILAAVDEDDRLMGYAFCIFQQHPDDRILTDIKTLYLDDLCVDESCRGQRIGQALYQAVLAYAKDHDCYNVTLNVWAGNESAHQFYVHRGMHPQKYGMEVIL